MTVKDLVLKTGKAAALIPGALGKTTPDAVVILIYHRIGVDGGQIALSRPAFRDQLEWLSAERNVTGLGEAFDGSSNGDTVVTFDDGYQDFHEHALPLLVEHRIPATLYLTTGLVDEGTGGDRGMTWSQVEEAVSTGLVTVGAHTHSHVDLATASADVAGAELTRSKSSVEDRLGVPCDHFAYPFAVGSPAADLIVRRSFRTAALHAWKTNDRTTVDLHALGRVPVLAGDGAFFFRAKARGRLDAERFFYMALRRGPWRRERV